MTLHATSLSNYELRLPHQERVKYAMLGGSEVVVGTSIASYVKRRWPCTARYRPVRNPSIFRILSVCGAAKVVGGDVCTYQQPSQSRQLSRTWRIRKTTKLRCIFGGHPLGVAKSTSENDGDDLWACPECWAGATKRFVKRARKHPAAGTAGAARSKRGRRRR